MADESPTLPTNQTILDEVRAGFASIGERLSTIERRLGIVEAQLVQMDARNDRIEGIFLSGRAEVLGLRADCKEFRAQFKENA